jgi:hypothetical protein
LWLGQAHKTGEKHFKGKQDSGLGQECKAGQEWFNWNQASGFHYFVTGMFFVKTCTKKNKSFLNQTWS